MPRVPMFVIYALSALFLALVATVITIRVYYSWKRKWYRELEMIAGLIEAECLKRQTQMPAQLARYIKNITAEVEMYKAGRLREYRILVRVSLHKLKQAELDRIAALLRECVEEHTAWLGNPKRYRVEISYEP